MMNHSCIHEPVRGMMGNQQRPWIRFILPVRQNDPKINQPFGGMVPQLLDPCAHAVQKWGIPNTLYIYIYPLLNHQFPPQNCNNCCGIPHEQGSTDT